MSRLVCVCLALLLTTAYGQLYGPNRAQTIRNIFQIPIQTLSAISNVAQNTRPIGQVIQQIPDRFRPPASQQQQFPQGGFGPQQFQQGNYGPQQFQQGNYRPQQYYQSRAARIAGLYTAMDGSGFRI